MFCLISGAHSGPISRIWSEFGPGPIQDLKIVFFLFFLDGSQDALACPGASRHILGGLI